MRYKHRIEHNIRIYTRVTSACFRWRGETRARLETDLDQTQCIMRQHNNGVLRSRHKSSAAAMLFPLFVALATAGAFKSEDGASSSWSWHTAYTGLRASTEGDSVMVDPLSPLKLRWAFSCGRPTCAQAAFRAEIWERGAGPPTLAYDTATVPSALQAVVVPAGVVHAATRYFWRVEVTLATPTAASTLLPKATHTQWSSNTTFFTALGADWGGAEPVWVPRNASGDQPMFALLRSSADIQPGDRVVSALAFATANAPTAQMEDDQKIPPKILAAYKLWVGGRLIGMGPGRARCGPLPCIHNPAFSVETPYDGFDVTKVVTGAASASGRIDMFVTGFGIDQSHDPQPSGTAKVMVALRVVVVRSTAPTTLVLQTGKNWRGMDASEVYRPAGNSGSSKWYYYPQENVNAAAIPDGTPLSPTASARHKLIDENDRWAPVEVQAHFPAPLAAKPTSPAAVHTQTAVTVRKLGGGHYAFDMGRNIQAGLRLTLRPLGSPPVPTNVTIRVAEELNSSSRLFWPPRTGLHPQMTWSFSPTEEAQTLENHEYLEFRYGELVFSDELISGQHFEVTARVLRIPTDNNAGARVTTSEPALDAVWELSRYAILKFIPPLF